MEVNTVLSAVGSFGFPIVACIALFWYITKQNDNHKKEMDKMAEAINNNTKVMNSLLEKIEKGELK